MTLADNLIDGSTDNDQNDNDDLREKVEKWAQDADHTMSMVDNSNRVTADKVKEVIEALEDDEDNVKEVYEAYREVIDVQRKIGEDVGQADSSNTDFTDDVKDFGSLDDFKPVRGEIMVPLYAWNKQRKNALRGTEDNPGPVRETGGNFPAYKALYPEPETDELTLWEEVGEVGPSGHDSHIYASPDMLEAFEMCPNKQPPETVEEYKEHRGVEDDDEPEETTNTDMEGRTAADLEWGELQEVASELGVYEFGMSREELEEAVDENVDLAEPEGNAETTENDEEDTTTSDTDHGFTQEELEAALELTDGNKAKALKLLKDME